ncbi:hypothetical protein BSKO_09721 [Bryopsis sp. KO-2023]|nr:hypothetical protein BSKO_09721 [Bryopsis sp. KO-2023]
MSVIGDEAMGLTGFSFNLASLNSATIASGSYATHTTHDASTSAKKPSNVSHADAAGIPLAALTAWKALVDTAESKDGSKALILGGVGGVTTFPSEANTQNSTGSCAAESRANFSMGTVTMCRPRCGGSLLSTILVVACLATVCLPQSDSAGGSGCVDVRAVVEISARVILDSASLKELENDVQSLANCLPVGGVLEFDLAELVLDDSVELRSPITIEGNGASVQCPGDEGKGAFKIRCLE